MGFRPDQEVSCHGMTASRLLGVWLTFFLGYSYIMDGPAGAKRTKLVLFSILFDEMHYQHSFHSILFRFMLL